MTRILSHYFSRQMLRKAAFDLSFLLLSTFAVFLAFADGIDQFMPQAGGPMLSVAAGLFVVTICAVCQAQTAAAPVRDKRQILITTKFIEAPVADIAARLPALKSALTGKPTRWWNVRSTRLSG